MTINQVMNAIRNCETVKLNTGEIVELGTVREFDWDARKIWVTLPSGLRAFVSIWDLEALYGPPALAAVLAWAYPQLTGKVAR